MTTIKYCSRGSMRAWKWRRQIKSTFSLWFSRGRGSKQSAHEGGIESDRRFLQTIWSIIGGLTREIRMSSILTIWLCLSGNRRIESSTSHNQSRAMHSRWFSRIILWWMVRGEVSTKKLERNQHLILIFSKGQRLLEGGDSYLASHQSKR